MGSNTLRMFADLPYEVSWREGHFSREKRTYESAPSATVTLLMKTSFAASRGSSSFQNRHVVIRIHTNSLLVEAP